MPSSHLALRALQSFKHIVPARTFILVLALNCLSAIAVWAQDPPLDVEEPKSKASIYEYQLENRADPFVPFITETAAASKVDMNEILDVEGPLTGMQLFEPGQLTLVALLKIGDQDVAMVEDFTGKGYVLSEGMLIGRRGIITDISQKSVVVEETAQTRAGKKIVSEVVMILKKEGEE